MTLEQLIADNTAAIRELARVLVAGNGITIVAPAPAPAPVPEPAPSPAAPPAAAEPAPAARRPGRPRKEPPAVAPGSERPSALPPPDPSPAAANDGAGYMDASRALSALLAARGREVALGVLQSFGASNLKEVPPAQWPAVREAAQKALEAA
jgi:hypothetical protein